MAENGKIEVEKGIRLSPPRPRYGAERYPWDSMEVSDSFFTTDAEQIAITWAGQRYGRRFVMQREGEGWRIWRIE